MAQARSVTTQAVKYYGVPTVPVRHLLLCGEGFYGMVLFALVPYD